MRAVAIIALLFMTITTVRHTALWGSAIDQAYAAVGNTPIRHERSPTSSRS